MDNRMLPGLYVIVTYYKILHNSKYNPMLSSLQVKVINNLCYRNPTDPSVTKKIEYNVNE